jgi:hypothetical protein
VLAAAVLAAAPGASASKFIQTGLFDDAQILWGNPDKVFPLLKSLNTQLIRVNLYWGGPNGVAKRRPASPTNPNDSAYDWATYDRTVQYASQYGIKVVFSIVGTPAWANGGGAPNVAPKNALDLGKFAEAAATRYSGLIPGPDGRLLPAVRSWLVWNEPNNPLFLSPQYRKVGGKWVIQSAVDYAKMCNAVAVAVHGTAGGTGKVACGVTGPRGNNDPGGDRPSVSPLAFLRAMAAAGAKGFDAYAQHPYYGTPKETPSTSPPAIGGAKPTAVTLGNFNALVQELTRLYGAKMRIWITEYGYQTNPPDLQFGVSYAKQALYLTQAYALAKANPRVDMFLWFLITDEPALDRWQSGLFTASGKKKPIFAVFQKLHG